MRNHIGVEVDQQLGNYRLIRLLGRGSYAEVYLGEHLRLHTQVAIKVLHTLRTSEDRESFLSEAYLIANLKHENVVRVLDFDVEDEIPFLIMDYASRGTLRQHHPKGIPLPPTAILAYVKQAAAGLQYVHDNRLIHRDIKPQNILLGAKNEVWLSDFGIAVTARNTLSLIIQNNAGSPAYMAPEQFGGKPRPASDQYALGVVVYEWLCGDLPFHGSILTLYNQHTSAPPPPMREKVPEIADAIEKVVLQALAKDPHSRFARVQDFADALEQACSGAPYLLPASTSDFLPPWIESSQVASAPKQSGSARASFHSPVPTSLLPDVLPPLLQDAFAVKKLHVPEPSADLDRHTKSPGLAPLPGAPVSAQTQVGLKRKFSRRTLVAVLLGSAAVTATGVGTLVWEHIVDNRPSYGQHTHTPTPSIKPTSPALSTPTPLPPGHTISTYAGHSSDVTAVAWSPLHGKRIASGSGDSQADVDHTVQVWDATTGAHIFSYGKHLAEVKTVAWSRDGKYLASGSVDKTVRVWDASTGIDLAFSPYTGHTERVRSVTWSPDGKSIASGSKDKTVQVWNASTGNRIFSYPYPNEILAVAWSPDGKYIAFGGFHPGPTVQVWDFANNRLIFSYTHHTDDVRGLAWSPDSTRITSGSYDHSAHIWDATTGNHVVTCSVHSLVNTIAWSPDGKYIASGSVDHKVNIWDATTGNHVYTYTGATDEVWAVAWSPDSRLIASGSNDHKVRVWSL